MIPPAIDIHPAAVNEARNAYRWYRRRSPQAASRFQAALEAALEQIAQSPDRYPVYLHGTRFRLLRRFPYIVVYRQLADRLQVVAVAHGRRRPGYWKRRKLGYLDGQTMMLGTKQAHRKAHLAQARTRRIVFCPSFSSSHVTAAHLCVLNGAM